MNLDNLRAQPTLKTNAMEQLRWTSNNVGQKILFLRQSRLNANNEQNSR